MPNPEPTRDDDYQKFVELFTAHERSLRAFIRSLVPTWHDADELVQEVALTAWQKFNEFEVGTSFTSWTYTIARFKALSYRRKMARDRLAFRSDLLELLAEEGATEEDTRQCEYEALETCMKKLPETQRKWVMLAYTPGQSAKEEAEALGIRPNTFYMRINRIRNDLFECIQRNLATPEVS